ncbi:MAG: hypothetical protein RL660_1119 [Bacteroidota bacterium]|jgi:hypothetical protein
MKNKLPEIYKFLAENRSYNKPIQTGAYQTALMPFATTHQKVYSLLHQILNSQSQLKMNKSAEFFLKISANKNSLNSFANFLKVIGATSQTPHTYKAVHQLLKGQPSWGNKTAALLVKAIYQCHNGYAKHLQFWKDAPSSITKADELYLPVDAVINFIFTELGRPCAITFTGINKYINETMPNSNMEIWDDLWFWGFITQNSENGKRTLKWNENKYWNLLNSPKEEKTIKQVEKLAEQFINIIK